MIKARDRPARGRRNAGAFPRGSAWNSGKSLAWDTGTYSSEKGMLSANHMSSVAAKVKFPARMRAAWQAKKDCDKPMAGFYKRQ
jgi:hypothetical protein